MKTSKTLCAFLIAAFSLYIVPLFAQKTPNLSDPEIASVAVTANQVDVDYAKIAQEKSKDANILSFAQAMSKDHQAVIEQAKTLVGDRLHITPKENAISKQLTTDAEETKKALNSKTGADFDKAYIDNEVTYHKSVISTVQDVLIPQTKDAELKEFLQQVLPILKSHLEHAMMVQSQMSK